MLVSNDEFVTRLTKFFEGAQEKGSIYVSQKRYTHEDGNGDAPMADAEGGEGEGDGKEYPILMRATDGKDEKKKKIKFSTLVHPSSLESFQTAYYTALRGSLSSTLRKRDKARERKVDKALAASRKRLEEQGGKVPTRGVGRKRGAGHRKRQRAEKRASKVRRDKARASANTANASTANPGVQST